MKSQIRQQKLLERLNHHPDTKKTKDLEIIKKITKTPEFKKANTILIYLPIKGEVDLSYLLKKPATAPLLNKKFVLPRVVPKMAKKEGKMDLYYVKKIEKDTIKGSFNILEPKSHLKITGPKDLDLAIIPGIAFSMDGHRIGYGKGFYDRLLKKTKCPKFGVAYDFQIVDNVPGEKHDIKMDIIITDKKIYHMKAKAKMQKPKSNQ